MNSGKSMEATFSTLILSIASSAFAHMGLAPNPASQKTEKNLEMAQYSIDLLILLQDKTKGNLAADEQQYLDAVIADLQMRYIQSK